MRKQILLTFLIVLLVASNAFSATIRGFVLDSESREPIPGATVQVMGTVNGVAANLDGYFFLSNLGAGTYRLRIGAIGYQHAEEVVKVVEAEPATVEFKLSPTGLMQQEIQVEADVTETAEARVSPKVSTVALESSKIRSVPALLGETDVLRMVQAIPGVKSASEVSSGLYIRGGNSAMTLIEMDQSALYNPSHLFGIFSTFNGDAVKYIQLMKGGFPAEYGGRAGSILEVVTKEGNRNRVEGSTSIGIISSRGALEGPLPDKRGSYAVSARRTYFDILLEPFRSSSKLIADIPRYYFYDVNGKVNFDLTPKTTLTVAGYTGLDNLKYDAGAEDSKFQLNMNWGNKTMSSRLRHVIGMNSFITAGATYSKYRSNFDVSNSGHLMNKLTSNFEDIMLRSDYEYHGASNHSLRTGIEFHRFAVNVLSNSEETQYASIIAHTWNGAQYIQDNWKISPHFEINPGFRWYWNELGDWVRFDPRLAMVYHYDPKTRLKLAGGRYHQWIEPITFGATSSIFDMWVPNDGTATPMYSDQIVLGLEHDPTPEMDATLESYYTWMHDVNEYDQSIDRGKTMKDAYVKGEGNAYGVEMMLRQKSGRLSGWIGYSLSWTKRHFPGSKINNGNWYYPKWDRRHDIVMVSTYQVNSKWDISAQWKYNTGQGYTRALGTYTSYIPYYPNNHFNDENRRMLYGSENNYRFPADHRLDVSAVYKTTCFSKPASWTFSIYNLYNRRAVWFRQYDTNKNPVEVTDVKLLPILPMVSYDVKF